MHKIITDRSWARCMLLFVEQFVKSGHRHRLSSHRPFLSLSARSNRCMHRYVYKRRADSFSRNHRPSSRRRSRKMCHYIDTLADHPNRHCTHQCRPVANLICGDHSQMQRLWGKYENSVDANPFYRIIYWFTCTEHCIQYALRSSTIHVRHTACIQR